jgi:riboflavin synthase alpha subunit
MKRLSIAVVVVLVLVLAFVAGTYAAAKSYQFSGVVKAVDGGSLTVEKSAKETWQFELAKDTKGGTPKVGDKVTVYYKMVTTEIEQKPATTSAAKKK